MKLNLSNLTQNDAAIFVTIAAAAIQDLSNCTTVLTLSVGAAIDCSGVFDQPFEGIPETPEFLATELSVTEWWNAIKYLADRATRTEPPAASEPDPLLPRLSDPIEKELARREGLAPGQPFPAIAGYHRDPDGELWYKGVPAWATLSDEDWECDLEVEINLSPDPQSRMSVANLDHLLIPDLGWDTAAE
ncbi:MAG TPA: hypothetical protein V6D27_01020 [Vampirovibrionales bacterium]